MLAVVSLDTYYTIPSTIPNDQLYWDGTTNITIQADIFISSLTAHHSGVIRSWSGAPGIRNVYEFGIVGTNKCGGYCPSAIAGAVMFFIGTEGVSLMSITTTTTVSSNTWTTIMVKRISGSYSLYINGVSQTTNTHGSIDSNVIGNAALPVIVGDNLNGQLKKLFVNGNLIGKHRDHYYYPNY